MRQGIFQGERPAFFYAALLSSPQSPPGCGELADFLAGIVPFYFSVCYTGFKQPSTTAAHFPTCRIALKAYPVLLQNSLLHAPIFSLLTQNLLYQEVLLL